MICKKCKDTGRIKVPNNQNDFDREFDRLYDTGQFNGEMAEIAALKSAGYSIEPCTECEKGKEYANYIKTKE